MSAYVLFSGGHDSLCATHYAMTNGLAAEVVHVNTGIGIEDTRAFVRDTCAAHGWPLNELSPPVPYEALVVALKERALAEFARERKPKRGAPFTYISGVRRQESARRMRGQQQEFERAPKLGWTWRAVILDWTKADCNAYIEANGLRRNEVVDVLHMSGECLCGSFARPGEREEIRQWYPETAAQIEAIEARVREAGHPACVWGQRPPNVHRDQLRLDDEPMLCVGCAA